MGDVVDSSLLMFVVCSSASWFLVKTKSSSAFPGGAEPKDGAGVKAKLWDGRRPLQHMKKPPQMEQHISKARPGKWGHPETHPANSVLSYGEPGRNCSRKDLLEAEQLQGCAQLSPWGVHPFLQVSLPERVSCCGLPWLCGVGDAESSCWSRNALPGSFPSLKNYPCREGISKAQGQGWE